MINWRCKCLPEENCKAEVGFSIQDYALNAGKYSDSFHIYVSKTFEEMYKLSCFKNMTSGVKDNFQKLKI